MLEWLLTQTDFMVVILFTCLVFAGAVTVLTLLFALDSPPTKPSTPEQSLFISSTMLKSTPDASLKPTLQQALSIRNSKLQTEEIVLPNDMWRIVLSLIDDSLSDVCILVLRKSSSSGFARRLRKQATLWYFQQSSTPEIYVLSNLSANSPSL